jgi:hypothetical protein
MKDTRTYKIYPSNLDIVDAIKQFDEYLSKADYKPNNQYNKYLVLEVDPYRKLYAGSWAEFIDLLERYPAALPKFDFRWKKNGNIEITVQVNFYASMLEMSAKSDDPDRVAGLHEILKTVFKASNPPVSYKPISRYNLKKSIFITHRFDDRGKEIAGIISNYCSLLGFEVKDGMGWDTKAK